MKFTRLYFDDCKISSYSNDFLQVLNDISLNVSPNAIRIHFLDFDRGAKKRDFYSKFGLDKERCWGFSCDKCYIYDIDIQNLVENNVYIFKYLGWLVKDSKTKKFELDNYQIDMLKYDKYLLFNNSLYYCNNEKYQYTDEELELLLKESIYKEDKKFNKLKKEIDLFEKVSKKYSNERKREPIPEEIKFEVWRRDEGKCVLCGSKEKLEFDHIIPFSKGGGNSARNLQLLCESCNRQKSDKI